jgi:hypothetical protein
VWYCVGDAEIQQLHFSGGGGRGFYVVISLCWLSSLGRPSESESMSDMSMTGNGFPTFDVRLELLGWERRRGERMGREVMGWGLGLGLGQVMSSQASAGRN